MIVGTEVIDRLERHAEEAYPEEGCGVLLGFRRDGRNVVSHMYPAENENRTDRNRRYLITPDTYRSADAYADEHGWDVVGVYHSHPDHPAEPSETDLERATFPGFSYVIVSVEDGTAVETTSWSLLPDRSRFEEESITAGETV